MNLPDDDGPVKIAVRERPLREILKLNDVPSVVNYHSSNSNIIVVEERPFAFDNVLPPSVSQKELFDLLVLPLVSKVLKGFNCTALAYGQTGTGKSYTMGLNPESLEGDNVGMIPRCLQEILFNRNQANDGVKKDVSASFIEIYSEKVYDLLGDNPSEPIVARGYKFTGGTKKTIENIQDGYELLNQGTKNRHVRPTKMNAQSSRSHAIFTIYIRSERADKIIQSCLNLVDLAGSEGVRRTGHQGVALSEGVHINQGLLSIGKVLQAITHGYKVIPYRDSVLSSVLQDSLNSNSYFTLLACISPHREDLSETLSTLRFAQSAKNLKHNPQINSKLMELKRAKTPFRSSGMRPKNSLPTPTPYKRPFSLVNAKQSSGSKNPVIHGNTFCTPGKKRNTENIRLNNTEIGLTPKEKEKIGSVQMPVSKVAPFSHEPSVRESLDDRYFDTTAVDTDFRGSLSLNISSSTAIDAQPIKNSSCSIASNSLVRKCMAEMIEMTLKETQSCRRTPTEIKPSPLTVVEEKIRNIVRQELVSMTAKRNLDTQNEPVDKKYNNVRCELFRASSPIFKIPEIPGVKPLHDFYSSQSINSTQNENLSYMDDTVLSAKPLRRSRRLSVKTRALSTDSLVAMPKRRSTRLSSIKTLHDTRRKSIRLASHTEKPEELDEEKPGPSVRKSKCTKKTKVIAPVDNTIIAGYFEEKKTKQPANVKTALARHQKAILDMLNEASMKDLQFLPQVGLKTAFQIVTQRTLHGKFKNFTQVSKLPIWRGKAWERFKEANNIS